MFRTFLMIFMLTMTVCANAHLDNRSKNTGTQKSPFFVKIIPPEGTEEKIKKQEELALERDHRQEVREINKAANDESLTTTTKWLAAFTFGLMAITGWLWITTKNAGLRQTFDTKYFELVNIHRDNVAELQLQNARGRKIFVLLIREFREILDIAKLVANYCKLKLRDDQFIAVAYYCLYFGTGPNSSRMLKNALNQTKIDGVYVEELEKTLNNHALKALVQNERNFGYVPFEGHQSRLGHYYRHLYQAVSYVKQRGPKNEKYEYVKTIRAQLSTHEQALLLLNSLTPIGQNWWKNDYMANYKMVKNIPFDFFDDVNEIDLTSLFEPGYFEWEDVK